jgi:hypothetical protein
MSLADAGVDIKVAALQRTQGGIVLDWIHIAVQGFLGTGLLYGSILTFRNWHLSGGDTPEQNHA